MKTTILILLFSISFAAALFFFVFCVVQTIKNKKTAQAKALQNGEKKKTQFKDLPPFRKRLIIALIVFFTAALILQNIIFALIASVLYAYFNWYFANKKAKERSALIDKQVIEALTVIKNAVQSGQSLQTAISTAYEELKEPIKSEFLKMSDSLSLGVSFDKVLNDASASAPSKEFRLMTDTLKISKDSGASLAGIFDRIIETTSQRVAVQNKVNALTAQGRMSGNIVSVIPFAVIAMMYAIEPDMMISLFTTFAGNILLLITVIMVLAGSFAIRKITEIDF
ncbi:MAG: type II secretion system F family protein [Endomicrobium sp.]|jgi:tight adherence protein B|nr:type II secretion system F family protein [Endomicrobium sp.]